jgi:hypothetical protein
MVNIVWTPLHSLIIRVSQAPIVCDSEYLVWPDDVPEAKPSVSSVQDIAALFPWICMRQTYRTVAVCVRILPALVVQHARILMRIRD